MSERANIAKNLLGFEVGDVVYGLDIQCVREIIRPLPMQTLPHAPKMVVGVIDHRGDVVPLIDLRIRFEAAPPSAAAQPRWIIVEQREHLVGLVVDRVTEVFAVADAEDRQVPELGEGSVQRGISGAYLHGGRLVFVVESDILTDVVGTLPSPRLLSSPEAL